MIWVRSLIRLIALIIFCWGGLGCTTDVAIAQPLDNSSASAWLAEPYPTNPQSEIERIKAQGKIIVAMVKQDNPPFFSTSKKGKLFGLDVDLAQSLADSLNVKVEFLRTPKTFDEVIETVYRGEADLGVSKLARSLPRAQKVLFSQPYLTFRQALLVNRLQLAKLQATGLSIDQIVKDFRSSIGVYAGSVYVQYAHATFPKATVVEFTKWSDAVNAVVSGQVTAIFRDEWEVRSIVLTKPELAINLRTIVLTDTRDTKGIITAWGNRFLADYTNLYLETKNQHFTTNQLLDLYAKEPS